MLAKTEGKKEPRTYALDRIHALEEMEKTFSENGYGNIRLYPVPVSLGPHFRFQAGDSLQGIHLRGTASGMVP